MISVILYFSGVFGHYYYYFLLGAFCYPGVVIYVPFLILYLRLRIARCLGIGSFVMIIIEPNDSTITTISFTIASTYQSDISIRIP